MLNPRLPLADLRRTYAAQRWVVIDDLLTAAAAHAVGQSIADLRDHFLLRVRNGVYPRTLTFDAPLPPRKQQVLERQLAVAQEHDLFTYLYYLFEPHADCEAHAVCALARYLGSPGCWQFIESVTGTQPVKCEVAGVTRYHQGHYLGAHSDRLAKFGPFRRKVAFILFFCPDWQPEMGGLLVHSAGSAECQVVVPGWNRVALLDVDHVDRHWVTPVEREGAERIAMPGFFCVPAG